MRFVARYMPELWADESAVSIPEYAMLLSLLTLGTVAIVGTLTDAVRTFFSSAGDELEAMQ